MAGSYNHITTDDGNLVSNEYFPNMIENLGDAYETVEELYGMIWWLASQARPLPVVGEVAAVVRRARQNYETGLEIARHENGAPDV